jgi:hypothetical protein
MSPQLAARTQRQHVQVERQVRPLDTPCDPPTPRLREGEHHRPHATACKSVLPDLAGARPQRRAVAIDLPPGYVKRSTRPFRRTSQGAERAPWSLEGDRAVPVRHVAGRHEGRTLSMPSDQSASGGAGHPCRSGAAPGGCSRRRVQREQRACENRRQHEVAHCPADFIARGRAGSRPRTTGRALAGTLLTQRPT